MLSHRSLFKKFVAAADPVNKVEVEDLLPLLPTVPRVHITFRPYSDEPQEIPKIRPWPEFVRDLFESTKNVSAVSSFEPLSDSEDSEVRMEPRSPNNARPAKKMRSSEDTFTTKCNKSDTSHREEQQNCSSQFNIESEERVISDDWRRRSTTVLG